MLVPSTKEWRPFAFVVGARSSYFSSPFFPQASIQRFEIDTLKSSRFLRTCSRRRLLEQETTPIVSAQDPNDVRRRAIMIIIITPCRAHPRAPEQSRYLYSIKLAMIRVPTIRVLAFRRKLQVCAGAPPLRQTPAHPSMAAAAAKATHGKAMGGWL